LWQGPKRICHARKAHPDADSRQQTDLDLVKQAFGGAQYVPDHRQNLHVPNFIETI
jgi:hypothetical protein